MFRRVNTAAVWGWTCKTLRSPRMCILFFLYLFFALKQCPGWCVLVFARLSWSNHRCWIIHQYLRMRNPERHHRAAISEMKRGGAIARWRRRCTRFCCCSHVLLHRDHYEMMMISNGSSPRIAVDYTRCNTASYWHATSRGFPVDGLVAFVLSTNVREVNSPLFFIRRRKEHASDSKQEGTAVARLLLLLLRCFDSFALMASESKGGWTGRWLWLLEWR